MEHAASTLPCGSLGWLCSMDIILCIQHVQTCWDALILAYCPLRTWENTYAACLRKGINSMDVILAVVKHLLPFELLGKVPMWTKRFKTYFENEITKTHKNNNQKCRTEYPLCSINIRMMQNNAKNIKTSQNGKKNSFGTSGYKISCNPNY